MFSVLQDESGILVEPSTAVEVLENGLHFMKELQATDVMLLVLKTCMTRDYLLLGQTDCGKPPPAKSQKIGMLDRCEEVRALQQAIISETYKAGGEMSEVLRGILAVFSQPVRPSATRGSRGPAARSLSMVPDGDGRTAIIPWNRTCRWS